jgi:hypothetical protein
LCEGKSFTRDLEQAYRTKWTEYVRRERAAMEDGPQEQGYNSNNNNNSTGNPLRTSVSSTFSNPATIAVSTFSSPASTQSATLRAPTPPLDDDEDIKKEFGKAAATLPRESAAWTREKEGGGEVPLLSFYLSSIFILSYLSIYHITRSALEEDDGYAWMIWYDKIHFVIMDIITL